MLALTSRKLFKTRDPVPELTNEAKAFQPVEEMSLEEI